jgi:hypothetical protein
MENMAHKMAIIQLMTDFMINFRWQGFKPLTVITTQGNIQRHNVFYVFFMNSTITNGRGGNGKSVQHCRLRFHRVTFEESPIVTIAKISF